MLILALILIPTVAGLMWIRWDSSHRVLSATLGALCMALGMRTVALATALGAGPLLVPLLGAQEPDAVTAQVQVEEPQAEAEAESNAPLPNVPRPEASLSDASGADAAEVQAESPDTDGDTPVAARAPVNTITEVTYLAKNRPAWVELPARYEGADYMVALLAGPHVSPRKSEEDLAEEISRTVAEYIRQQVGTSHADALVHFSLQELHAHGVIREQFKEQLIASPQVGLVNQAHALLVFDEPFRQEIDRRWSEIRSRSRLVQTGLSAGAILLLLGTLFSYFKLDTATKGYYTRRLQFVTAGTILALVAASVLLAKWIPGM